MMQIAGVDVKEAAVFGFIIFWVFFFMGLAIRQIQKETSYKVKLWQY